MSNFLNRVLPALQQERVGPITELSTALCASASFVIGLGFAYFLYAPWRPKVPREDPLLRLWYSGWGVDWLYDRVFVMPFQFVVRRSATDLIDYLYTGVANLADLGSSMLRASQNGRVRWYATGVAAGFIVLFAVVFFVR